jgi:hypothetical protein
MTILKHKDDGLFKAHGIRRCWFVQSTDQVFFEIKQNLSYLRNFKPSTFDFTTMYTKMQHDHILHNIQRSIQEAHQYYHRLTSLRSCPKDFPSLVDESRIMDHLRFIVQNTYLANNLDDIRQQTVGIPMGTNASPNIANLTLYMDEADFIDRIILNRGDAFDNLTSEQYKALYSFNEIDFIGRVLSINQRDPQIILARDYAFTKRYIDDLLLWGVQPPSQDDYRGLQYAQHSVDVNSVTFLGSTITKLPNCSIIMSIYK